MSIIEAIIALLVIIFAAPFITMLTLYGIYWAVYVMRYGPVEGRIRLAQATEY